MLQRIASIITMRSSLANPTSSPKLMVRLRQFVCTNFALRACRMCNKPMLLIHCCAFFC